MKFEKKNLLLAVVSLVITLIFTEFALQILSLTVPRVDYVLSRAQENTIPDEKVIYRPNPLHPEHDERGWRNAYVPDKTCVVALGDSQTYGLNVLPDQAWPHLLGSLGNLKTYNMAYSSYGPIHNYLLLEEAISLKPELIIAAFYAGNDLVNAYEAVYMGGLAPELRPTDAKVQAVLKEDSSKEFDFTVVVPQEKHGSLIAFLAEHSKLYGVLRAAKRGYLYEYNYKKKDPRFATDWESVKQLALQDERAWIFEGKHARTVFWPRDHRAALNFSDARIAEGFRLSLEVYRLMNEETHSANAEFMVLLIPTKELVFKDVVYEESTEVPETFKTLIESEERFWQETKRYLSDHDIYFIDALPALQAVLQEGNQPFPVSADDHKSGLGHEAVAKYILPRLERNFRPALEACRNTTAVETNLAKESGD